MPFYTSDLASIDRIVSIENYGTITEGADISAPLRRALDVARLYGKRGVVFVPAGSYRVRPGSSSLPGSIFTVQNGNRLIGDGTVLTLDTTVVDGTYTDLQLFHVETNGSLEGFVLDGDKAALRTRLAGTPLTGSLITARDSSNVTVIEVELRNQYGQGGESSALSFHNVTDYTIMDVRSHHNEGMGMRITGYMSDGTLTGVEADNNTLSGVKTVSGRSFHDNTNYHHNTLYGAEVDSTELAIFSTSLFSSNTDGLLITGPSEILDIRDSSSFYQNTNTQIVLIATGWGSPVDIFIEDTTLFTLVSDDQIIRFVDSLGAVDLRNRDYETIHQSVPSEVMIGVTPALYTSYLQSNVDTQVPNVRFYGATGTSITIPARTLISGTTGGSGSQTEWTKSSATMTVTALQSPDPTGSVRVNWTGSQSFYLRLPSTGPWRFRIKYRIPLIPSDAAQTVNLRFQSGSAARGGTVIRSLPGGQERNKWLIAEGVSNFTAGETPTFRFQASFAGTVLDIDTVEIFPI